MSACTEIASGLSTVQADKPCSTIPNADLARDERFSYPIKISVLLEQFDKSIANDCVIPRHCKHFHSPIFSYRSILSVSFLSRAAKPYGAWNNFFVMTRHFITRISYYKLPINHFLLYVCGDGQGQIIPLRSNCKFQKYLFNLCTYFVSLSTDPRRAVVSYWRKYVHEKLVNRLGGLSLPKKSVVRLSDRAHITIDVYRGVGGRVVRRCWVNFQCRGVLLIWIIVGQGPTLLAAGEGGFILYIFPLVYHFFLLSSSLWETARYRLKYCLKGPFSPKQPTDQRLPWT